MSMQRAAFYVVAALLLTNAVPAAAQNSCDRACLSGFMTRYLDALVAHDPSKLPVAANLKFTEDTKPMKLGEGLWKTASGILPYRQDFIDVRAGVAGAHVLIEESGSPTLTVVRLKIVDRRIAEAETMVVRNRAEGAIFRPEALKSASPAMTLRPDKAQLNTREDAIRIAALYPAGLRAGSFVSVAAPFAADAYRFENGQLMAGPGCKFIAGCDNIKTQRIPKLEKTTYRLAAVDEEMGIVWFRLDFGVTAGAPRPNAAGGPNSSGAPANAGAPGNAGGPNNASAPPSGAGSPANAGAEPTRRPPSKLIVWEAFKVYGGQIHAVEAFMENMPPEAASGWPELDASAK
jgi:hypothetical protein